MSTNPYDPPGSPFVPPAAQPKVAKAGLPLGLGIFGMIAWLLPIIGLPVTIIGLVFGIKALNGPSKGMAIAAVVLCSLGLMLTLVNVAAGIYLAVTGQHPLVNQLQGK